MPYRGCCDASRLNRSKLVGAAIFIYASECEALPQMRVSYLYKRPAGIL